MIRTLRSKQVPDRLLTVAIGDGHLGVVCLCFNDQRLRTEVSDGDLVGGVGETVRKCEFDVEVERHGVGSACVH